MIYKTINLYKILYWINNYKNNSNIINDILDSVPKATFTEDAKQWLRKNPDYAYALRIDKIKYEEN